MEPEELANMLVDETRSALRNMLVEIENGCETSAKLADTCATEAAVGSAHSPEWFLGWRAAMLAIAEQMRMVANGRTLGSPHVTLLENVIPLRRDR